MKKKFYKFKLIEIMDEKTVFEHCTFIFPFYNGKMQRLYFSENTMYMLERLSNSRTNIYDRKSLLEGETISKFNLVKKIYPFNISLRGQSG